MTRLVRPLAVTVAAALTLAGLWLGDGLSDGRWLLLLGGAWLLALGAVWPRAPVRRGSGAGIAKIAVVLASVFALLAVQLARVQIVRQAATVERIASDPVSGEVIANPRAVNGDLAIDRGRIYDRNGEVIAATIVENGAGRRVYPDPRLAYVAGYFSPLLYGKSGLEAAYDDELSGEAGNFVARARDDLLHRARRGSDLHLTLDAGLQRRADELLAGRTGAVVVLDVETGAVLALASSPRFDPEPLFSGNVAENDEARAYWDGLVNDPGRPLVLRATDGLYTPGSTFKVITAAAAIDAGLATPDDLYLDDGSLEVDGHVIVEANRPDDSVDRWTLREGLAFSLNVVFARVGLQLGSDLLTEYAARFGFGEAPPFDIPVARSQIASRADFLDTNPAIADTAFGQGELLVSPLQMAMVAAAIANDGKMMRPYLVAAVRSGDGHVQAEMKPSVWRSPVSAETAATVREMMVYAVESGYVNAVAIPGLTVGGKTGTAETGDGEPHAWFIGFAGERDPEYAIAVVLEHGGSGLSAPLAIGREMLLAVTGAR